MKCVDLIVLEKVVIDSSLGAEFLRSFFFGPDGENLTLPPGYGVCCLAVPGGKTELMVLARSKP